jgi:hypothetical protein
MGYIVGKGDEKLNDVNDTYLMTRSHQCAVARFLKHCAVLIDTGTHSFEHRLNDPVLDERNAVVRLELPISSCVGSPP